MKEKAILKNEVLKATLKSEFSLATAKNIKQALAKGLKYGEDQVHVYSPVGELSKKSPLFQEFLENMRSFGVTCPIEPISSSFNTMSPYLKIWVNEDVYNNKWRKAFSNFMEFVDS